MKIKIRGFCFAGVSAGIKQTGKPDIALIVSQVPARVVGAFTSGKVQAAPVQVSRKNIRAGLCQAVIVNSGNANACTGPRGLRDAEAMVAETARLLELSPSRVLVSSTGKIGVFLPMKKVRAGIARAARELSDDSFDRAAGAILTTDHTAKVCKRGGRLGGKTFTVAGFAKGAGMIEPHMTVEPGLHATMLAYVFTDAVVAPAVLRQVFDEAVKTTFNAISVDGDMSTNDTALLLANGLAGNKPFTLRSPEGRRFAKAVHEVMEHLALEMVRDGEGALKCVRVEVRGARCDADAEKMAYTIANSALVKTSFFGEDPNWGRVMGALGRSGTPLDADRVSIHYDGVCVARRGMATGVRSDAAAKKVMKKNTFALIVDCRMGRGKHHVYTSDLGLNYVKLNSCYRT